MQRQTGEQGARFLLCSLGLSVFFSDAAARFAFLKDFAEDQMTLKPLENMSCEPLHWHVEEGRIVARSLERDLHLEHGQANQMYPPATCGHTLHLLV